jgi:hypothetical protein
VPSIVPGVLVADLEVELLGLLPESHPLVLRHLGGLGRLDIDALLVHVRDCGGVDIKVTAELRSQRAARLAHQQRPEVGQRLHNSAIA